VAVVCPRRGDERRQPRRHPLAREEERDAVQVGGAGLKSVHADRTVDVHVDEAGVERETFKVQDFVGVKVGRLGGVKNPRDLLPLDQQCGVFEEAALRDNPRVA
jgi:hypothetical protein